MRTYHYLPNNISFFSVLFLIMGALLSMTLYYCWFSAAELLLDSKSFGEVTPSHNLTKDKNNQKSVIADKQTNNTVLIVVNASNPTNKIFYDPSPITIKPGSSIICINRSYYTYSNLRKDRQRYHIL